MDLHLARKAAPVTGATTARRTPLLEELSARISNFRMARPGRSRVTNHAARRFQLG
jgi:hypothetical protein